MTRRQTEPWLVRRSPALACLRPQAGRFRKTVFRRNSLRVGGSSPADSSGTPGRCPASILCRTTCSKVVAAWVSLPTSRPVDSVLASGFVGVRPCPPEGLRGSFFAVTSETIPGLWTADFSAAAACCNSSSVPASGSSRREEPYQGPGHGPSTPAWPAGWTPMTETPPAG